MMLPRILQSPLTPFIGAVGIAVCIWACAAILRRAERRVTTAGLPAAKLLLEQRHLTLEELVQRGGQTGLFGRVLVVVLADANPTVESVQAASADCLVAVQFLRTVAETAQDKLLKSHQALANARPKGRL